jgi:hypothetical protein
MGLNIPASAAPVCIGEAAEMSRRIIKQRMADLPRIPNAAEVARMEKESLLALARQCDQHFKAAGDSLHQLHDAVVQLRMRHGGRGVSSMALWNGLERARADSVRIQS